MYYGVPKVSKTWEWYVEKWDSKILRAVRQPRKVPAFKIFPPPHQVKDISESTGRSPKSVEKSPRRLVEKKQVEFIDGGWSEKNA